MTINNLQEFVTYLKTLCSVFCENSTERALSPNVTKLKEDVRKQLLNGLTTNFLEFISELKKFSPKFNIDILLDMNDLCSALDFIGNNGDPPPFDNISDDLSEYLSSSVENFLKNPPKSFIYIEFSPSLPNSPLVMVTAVGSPHASALSPVAFVHLVQSPAAVTELSPQERLIAGMNAFLRENNEVKLANNTTAVERTAYNSWNIKVRNAIQRYLDDKSPTNLTFLKQIMTTQGRLISGEVALKRHISISCADEFIANVMQKIGKRDIESEPVKIFLKTIEAGGLRVSMPVVKTAPPMVTPAPAASYSAQTKRELTSQLHSATGLSDSEQIITSLVIFATEAASHKDGRQSVKFFRKSALLNHSLVMKLVGSGATATIEVFIKPNIQISKGKGVENVRQGTFKTVKTGGFKFTVSFENLTLMDLDPIVFFNRQTPKTEEEDLKLALTKVSYAEKKKTINQSRLDEQGFNYVNFEDHNSVQRTLCYALSAGEDLFSFAQTDKYKRLTPVNFRQGIVSCCNSLIQIFSKDKIPLDLKSENTGARFHLTDKSFLLSVFDCYVYAITYSPHKGRYLEKFWDIGSYSGSILSRDQQMILRKQFAFEFTHLIYSFLFNSELDEFSARKSRLVSIKLTECDANFKLFFLKLFNPRNTESFTDEFFAALLGDFFNILVTIPKLNSDTGRKTPSLGGSVFDALNNVFKMFEDTIVKQIVFMRPS